MMKQVFFLLFLMGVCQSASAQFYPTQFRPPHQNWQQLTTPHFKVLFPLGEDSTAWKTAAILEEAYPKIQKLTGGGLTNFPIILNNYNDLSNGFVTSLHFRSEIDISPIKGKTLNPENGGWLENVAPHELTHAVQYSHLGGFGLARFINIFSPDLARSLHGATPSGIPEGLAVYAESKLVTDGGGRGNYPFFNQQFNAVFNSPARWSLGQMVQPPAYNRPFNRNYIGGYAFTQWLQDTFGPKTSRDAIDFNIRWPFLGYGFALKHATGKWPAQLYHRFEKDKQQDLPPQKKSSATPLLSLPARLKGPEVRRPKWLSDSTLIFYASFYNARPGFYRYSLHRHNLHRIATTGSIGDYNYALSANKKSLIYSYYHPDAIYPHAYKNTLVQVSLTEGNSKNMAPGSRLYDPVFLSDSTLLALQTRHTYVSLVKLNTDKETPVKSLFSDADHRLVSVAVNPRNEDSLAVVMNHHGNQALWIASKKNLTHDLKSAPAVSFSGGSVFDPAWHPSGKRLLFSADFSGTLQVYEYDLSSRSITQITHAPYNAFEASYSPDGSRIAFIIQQENERLPEVLNRKDFYGKSVTALAAFNQPDNSAQVGLKLPSKRDPSWTQKPYATGFSWLKPRAVIPVSKEISGSNTQYQWGAGLYSSDLLQQQSYSLEATEAENKFWYDLTYQNKQFFPGFKARFFSKPAFRAFRFVTQSGDTLAQSFLRQERSFALSFPLQFTLQQNVYTTGLYLEPEIRQSQLRFFNRGGDEVSGFSNATIGRFFEQFNYKLQQDIRSVQPNSGALLFSEVEHYFHSGGLTLQTQGGNASLNFAKPTALRGGIFGYVSPLRRWNQSLRIGLEGITQTKPVFDNQFLVSDGFSGPVFPFSNNLVGLNARYTIPVFYPDNGGFLVPLYLSGVYLVGFSNTVTDPTFQQPFSSSRTIVGGGIRFRFRISNLSLDIGAGLGFEPARNKTHFFIDTF